MSYFKRLGWPRSAAAFGTAATSVIAACWLGLMAPARGIEQVTVHVGPLKQTVTLADLETFVRTGEIPTSLRLYAPLLSPQVRQSLQGEFAIDADLSKAFLEEFLASPGGQQLLETLLSILPNLSEADLVTAFEAATQDVKGLSVLSILQQVPQQELEIDASTLLRLISQLNLARLESAALSHVLEDELAVEGELPAPTGAPFQPGDAEVFRWSLTLRDRSRDRTVPVDLYWSKQAHGPLVVLSHGFAADRHFFAYLASHLASHGLTVASVEHSGSNVDVLTRLPDTDLRQTVPNRILPASEFIDRPQDISFALDRLERLNAHAYALRGRVNTDQVVFIGHSLGGYTGLALAGARLDLGDLHGLCHSSRGVSFSPADWLQCAALDLPLHLRRRNLSDPRIQRLLVMNPLVGSLFGSEGLEEVTVPTLMIASSRDSVTPMAHQQLLPFTQMQDQASLLLVLGGSHLSVGDPGNLNAELQQVPFMPEVPGTATARLRHYLQGLSLSLIMQESPEAEQYRPFLDPTYAQAFSTDEVALRLSSDFPDHLTKWLQGANPVYQRSRLVDYLPSLLYLEAIALQRHLQILRRQMIAYLRTTPPSVTAISWPKRPRPTIYAQQRQEQPALNSE